MIHIWIYTALVLPHVVIRILSISYRTGLVNQNRTCSVTVTESDKNLNIIPEVRLVTYFSYLPLPTLVS